MHFTPTPVPPRCIHVTDNSALVSWTAPPSFNLEVNAFHLQYRVGLRAKWQPEGGLSLPPQFRSKLVHPLFGATAYQFRVQAENRLREDVLVDVPCGYVV